MLGVPGGLVLAGTGAIHGLGVRLGLLLPSGRRLGLVFQLRMWSAVRLGVPASLQLGCGFPGSAPGGAGIGGPLLVPGVAGLKALAFGGQLRGEGCGGRRAGVAVLGMSVGGLPVPWFTSTAEAWRCVSNELWPQTSFCV